ncbi:SusC/RagA family TonB-linked outer membrane protein [Polaribacter haliotis]|uniref:SusC/RagA family TonB-linked outer membrane protein n=1 Tax=Polaribacter haliotis TaxID=1888915 RepID=A0A7L8AG06_9FLAO|nr:SusC/RagA family TonB-linked outer membrane protein [Polaribacter haliotis]QOD60948.1 SusC/RagA family TonB-linked outer membrane protein [Polaribacter haliotis]
MKLKLRITLLVALLMNVCLFAQGSYTVKGTVTSKADNELLPGVSIIIEGTNKGTETDFDGNYSLTVKSGDVLQFSYLGFTIQKITIGNQKTVNVSLVQDASELDEIVVVGYGTRKKSHLTGAIAKVTGKDIAAVQTARVDEALAGKLPGVFIQNQSGNPGADPKIAIRAASSITGNSNPLIVVDGYPISGTLATVNPNDIESLEVLKDAASAAIYGSRGANGVILITSKKGKSGKVKFSYDAYTSFSEKYRDNINMTANQWGKHAEEQIANGNWDVSELEASAPGYVDYKLWGYNNAPDVVAIEDYVFDGGSTQSHNFSASGGSDTSTFFASLGYQNVDGITVTQDFERINARLSADTKLGDKFKAGLSFNGYTSNSSALEHDLRDILRGASIHPIYHTDASIAFVKELEARHKALGLRVSRQGGVNGFTAFDAGRPGFDIPGTHGARSIYDLQAGDPAWDWHYGRAGNGIGGSSNPGTASLIDNKSNTQKEYFANVSSYLEYNILDGLNIKTVLGGDFRDTQANQHYLVGGDNNGDLEDTYLNQQELKRYSVLSETTLNYTKVINDKHDISALIGMEFQKNYISGVSIAGNNVTQLLGEPLNYALLGNANTVVTEREEINHRKSVFGRVAYAYDDRYLVSASIRRDGDSRFGANNKYEIFPAFSAGWNVHNEAFFNQEGIISKLKPRISYGSLGTVSDLGFHNALSFINAGTSVLGNAYNIPNDLANPDLTWQTNTETNFGVDFGFIDNRFTLGLDYYTSDIEDILINQSVSNIFGRNSIRLNSGDVESSGLEFELGARLINNDNFSWNMGANLSTVNTKITDLGSLSQLPDVTNYGTSGRAAVYRNYVGGEIGELWTLETTGWVAEKHMINPLDVIGNSSGEVYVVDQNGDGKIDATKTVAEGGDLVKQGTNTPDFYWGMNHNFSYKNFDLSLQFQGSHGGIVYNVDPLYNGSNWGGRLRSSFDANSDGKEDATGLFYTRARDKTDAVIQDAGFLALRNLTFGYTLDDSIAQKVGLNSVRVYTAATNLLYIFGDNYTSYNPEGVDTSSSSNYAGPITFGHQSGETPVARTFTFGININF